MIVYAHFAHEQLEFSYDDYDAQSKTEYINLGWLNAPKCSQSRFTVRAHIIILLRIHFFCLTIASDVNYQSRVWTLILI